MRDELVLARALTNPPPVKNYTKNNVRIMMFMRPQHWYSGYNMVNSSTLLGHMNVDSCYVSLRKFEADKLAVKRRINYPGPGPARNEYCLTPAGEAKHQLFWDRYFRLDKGNYVTNA